MVHQFWKGLEHIGMEKNETFSDWMNTLEDLEIQENFTTLH